MSDKVGIDAIREEAADGFSIIGEEVVMLIDYIYQLEAENKRLREEAAMRHGSGNVPKMKEAK